MPAFLQRQTEIPVEKRSAETSELLKPRLAEDGENGAGRAREENPRIARGSKDPSLHNAANSDSKHDKQDSLLSSAKSEKNKPEDTKFDSDSGLEKRQTSDPARRIAANTESSGASSEASDASEAKSEGAFKRHDHAKYLEMIKNKAVDLVNSDKESDYAAICKDMITDQWSLILYYVREKTYTFTTYAWDEIDDNWQKSFASNKRQLTGLQKHLKYSSSGKECKVLKKAKR